MPRAGRRDERGVPPSEPAAGHAGRSVHREAVRDREVPRHAGGADPGRGRRPGASDEPQLAIRQGGADAYLVSSDPRSNLRRLSPDPVQFQVILGSLLGDARIVGGPFDRRMRIAHQGSRSSYVSRKYDRLSAPPEAAPADPDRRHSPTTPP